MPTENRSSNTEMVSVPPYIGLEPLVGRYYPAQCRRCGWVGSSEELTEDDAQCTRDAGDRLCLGDCDELYREDLLGIIQAMAKASQQHQGEPVAWLDPSADLSWLVDRMTVAPGTKLYTHADPAEVERLRAEVAKFRSYCVDLDSEKRELEHKMDAYKGQAEESATLRAQLAEAHALLREAHESGALYLEDHQPTAKTQALDDRIAAALSASAEPSDLPDPLGCNACSHADCGKYYGPRQVECRAMADNACARPSATS